jgi:hypothetical protein
MKKLALGPALAFSIAMKAAIFPHLQSCNSRLHWQFNGPVL